MHKNFSTKFSTLSTSFQHLIWGKLSSFCTKVFHFVKCFCAHCTKISGYCRTFTIFNKVFNFSTFFQFLLGALLKSFQLFNKVFNFFRGSFQLFNKVFNFSIGVVENFCAFCTKNRVNRAFLLKIFVGMHNFGRARWKIFVQNAQKKIELCDRQA